MAKEELKPDNFEIIRHHLRVVAIILLVIAVLSTLGWFTERWYTNNFTSYPPEARNGTIVPQGPILPRSAPVGISIPTLNLSAEFESPLGLNEDETIEVPEAYDTVAWYQFSPTPGELGPAVVLGHVDSHQGPAVFFKLKELKPGDEILIKRHDGKTAVFEVTALEKYEQAGFPSELVYSDINHSGLRLVTCTGLYNDYTQRYSHNLVVFAELKSTMVDEL